MPSSTKPTASKPQTAPRDPGAPASSAHPLAGPSLTTDGTAVVVAGGSGGGSSGSGIATTRAGLGDGATSEGGLAAGKRAPGETRSGARARGAGEAGGIKARESARGHMGEGPAANKGGRPKCGSLTAAEGAQASAIDIPDPDIISTGEYTPASENIPHLSPEYAPPSATNVFLGVQINIPPPESAAPLPGTSIRKPTIPARLGRDENGKIIPHERDEELAKAIARWCAVGADITEIAQYTGIRPGVLRKHYKMELENGKFAADMMVGETILDLAASGKSERMTLLYAKARMGWRESDANDQNNAAMLNIHIHA